MNDYHCMVLICQVFVQRQVLAHVAETSPGTIHNRRYDEYERY